MGAFFAVTLLVSFVFALMQNVGRVGNDVGTLSHGIGSPLCPGDTLFREEYVIGTFRNATRLARNPQGWLYVVDADENSVVLFQTQHAKPRSVGGYGWGTTSFDRPTGLAADGLSVYVADYHNHRILRFDRSLNYLSSFSTRDTAVVVARFGYPTGIAHSRLGDLFILDSENLRVLKFTGALQFERSFGGIDAERGKLRHPLKLLISPQDRVYVLEENRLVEFDYFGNLVRSIGEGALQKATGFDVGEHGVVVAAEDSLYWFSLAGELTRIQPLSELIASVSLAPLQDLAISGETLLLLTKHHVVAMNIVNAP